MKKQQAFTLIELMIAVAIVGILASIAYPGYQHGVLKSRRTDAKGALLGLVNAMERHYTESSSYCDAGSLAPGSCGGSGAGDTGGPSIFPAQIPATGVAYYNLTIHAVSENSYTLRATPTAAGGQNILAKEGCGNLEITNTGIKTPTTAGCW